MAQKTIPQLTETTDVDENTLFPVDSGIQTFKATGASVAKGLRNLSIKWNTSQTYDALDLVYYQGELWRSLVGTNTATTPGTDPTKWEPFKPGSLNPQVNPLTAVRAVTAFVSASGVSVALYSMAYSEEQDTLLAISNDGIVTSAVWKSTDGGATWAAKNAPASSSPTVWGDIAYSPELNIWVMVGLTESASEFQIASSVDGESWTGRTNPTGLDLWAVEWCSELGKFVAVGGDAEADAACYSSNGTSWTQSATVPEGTWGTLAWSGSLGKLVALSFTASGPEGDRAMTSADGDTWALVLIPSQNFVWHECIWVEELKLYVAVGSNATAANGAMTSHDGDNWTLRTMPAGQVWTGLAYSPELKMLLAVSRDGANRCASSPDAVTWTARSASEASAWEKAIWVPKYGKFVACAQSGTNVVMRSRYVKRFICAR